MKRPKREDYYQFKNIITNWENKEFNSKCYEQDLEKYCDNLENDLHNALLTEEEIIRKNNELVIEKSLAINELCLKCGKYLDSFKGACDNCRWHK